MAEQEIVKKKKSKGCLIAAIIGIAIVVILVLVIVCTGGGEASFTTAHLEDISIAEGIDFETYKPIGETDTFKVNSPEIYAIVALKNAPEGTVVIAEWWYS